MAFKDDKDKDFVCRACVTFLDQEELNEGECPNCESDESLFQNDDNEEE